MKKFIMVAALILAAVGGASAQRISFKADAAVGFSSGDYKVENFADFAGKTIVGYRISGGVEIPISYGLYVNPGIAFHSKGTKTDLGGAALGALGLNSSLKAQTHYIEIPVHVGYRVNVLNLLSVAVQAGPYFSYAIKGEATLTKENGQESTYDIYKDGIKELFDAKGKRFDMGLGAAAMVEYTRFYLLIGADFGLVNTLNDVKALGQDIETTLKNTSFHVGLGVRF